MSYENVKHYFSGLGMGDKVKTFDVSSATVELAAKAVGCEPARIAKTLSFFLDEDQPILVVMAGDARVDNKKYKAKFGQKAKMIPFEQVEAATGHVPGGVCPFAAKTNVTVYLDDSLKRFDVVYPAAGSGNSAVELTIPELEKCSGSSGWVNLAQDIES